MVTGLRQLVTAMAEAPWVGMGGGAGDEDGGN